MRLPALCLLGSLLLVACASSAESVDDSSSAIGEGDESSEIADEASGDVEDPDEPESKRRGGLPPHVPGMICATKEFWCWAKFPSSSIGSPCTCSTGSTRVSGVLL